MEEPRGPEYGSEVSGSDCPTVVKKRGNSRGAKVTRVLTNDGQLATGGTESLERKVKLSLSGTSRVTGDGSVRGSG